LHLVFLSLKLRKLYILGKIMPCLGHRHPNRVGGRYFWADHHPCRPYRPADGRGRTCAFTGAEKL
jgi:hypothetical protein